MMGTCTLRTLIGFGLTPEQLIAVSEAIDEDAWLQLPEPEAAEDEPPALRSPAAERQARWRARHPRLLRSVTQGVTRNVTRNVTDNAENAQSVTKSVTRNASVTSQALRASPSSPSPKQRGPPDPLRNSTPILSSGGESLLSQQAEPQASPVTLGVTPAERTATKAEVDAVWNAGTGVARRRSSWADCERKLTAALHRGAEPADVARSLRAAYASDDYHGDKAPGIHRLIENDRWKGWLEAAPPEPAALTDQRSEEERAAWAQGQVEMLEARRGRA